MSSRSCSPVLLRIYICIDYYSPCKIYREAYRSYLLAYASHSMKGLYNVHELDLAAVGKSFGFMAPPRVDLR